MQLGLTQKVLEYVVNVAAVRTFCAPSVMSHKQAAAPSYCSKILSIPCSAIVQGYQTTAACMCTITSFELNVWWSFTSPVVMQELVGPAAGLYAMGSPSQ